MNNNERRKALINKLSVISGLCATQEHAETDSVGISFEYLGIMYTIYIDADTEQGELLKHNKFDITEIESLGTTSAQKLIDFFSVLPSLESILS